MVHRARVGRARARRTCVTRTFSPPSSARTARILVFCHLRPSFAADWPASLSLGCGRLLNKSASRDSLWTSPAHARTTGDGVRATSMVNASARTLGTSQSAERPAGARTCSGGQATGTRAIVLNVFGTARLWRHLRWARRARPAHARAAAPHMGRNSETRFAPHSIFRARNMALPAGQQLLSCLRAPFPQAAPP